MTQEDAERVNIMTRFVIYDFDIMPYRSEITLLCIALHNCTIVRSPMKCQNSNIHLLISFEWRWNILFTNRFAKDKNLLKKGGVRILSISRTTLSVF